MKSIFSVLICLIVFQISFAQSTIIRGNAKTYSGDTLYLYTYRDFITKKQEIISKTAVDTSGNFEFNFDIPQTRLCFIELYVFRGIIYLEQGKEYNIVLPKKTIKAKEDELNPYFKVEEFYMTPRDTIKTELNKEIKRLDIYSDKCIMMLFKNFHGSVNPAKVEKVLSAINDSFPDISNPYFEDYKKYRYAEIRHMTYQHDKRRLIKTNFAKSEVLYNSNEYNEAYDKIVDDFFEEVASNELKNEFTEAVKNKKKWTELNKIAKKDSLLQEDQFREYVILKSLQKSFYVKNFMKKEILEIMSSASISSSIQIHQEIASDFVKKAGKLLEGNISPELNLKNVSGETVMLDNLSGKFIYLNFMEKDNHVCEKEIETLVSLNARKIELLEIVTIWTGGTYEDMLEYVTRGGYSWTFLYADSENRILEDYDVKVFPTYYLIHPEGTLVMKPAPGPASEFESRYYHVYNDWKRELLRRNSNNSTIKN